MSSIFRASIEQVSSSSMLEVSLYFSLIRFLLKAVGSPSECEGYNFSIDWWSLGITAFELKTAGLRPFDIGPATTVSEAVSIFETSETRIGKFKCYYSLRYLTWNHSF